MHAKKRITYRQIAKQSGYGRSMIHQILTGQRKPSKEAARDIANALIRLGVDIQPIELERVSVSLHPFLRQRKMEERMRRTIRRLRLSAAVLSVAP